MIIYEFLEEYLEEIRTDLNLRLLCEKEEGEYHLPGRILWVENIEILSFEPPAVCREISGWEAELHRAGQAAKELIKRLTESWERRTPRTLKNKSKKKGR